MNYISNQIRKVLEETLADFNYDDVKIILRRLHCFKMTVSLLQVLQKPHPIPRSPCYKQQRVEGQQKVHVTYMLN